MSVEQQEQSFGESMRLPKTADRRREQRSDTTISTRAASLEAAIRENLVLEESLESSAAEESPKQSLVRLLSIKSVISTTSSFAQRQQAAVGGTPAFREIGTGSIGKVFEHPGTVWAYKLPLTDDVSKLWNNYIMNRRIEESFEQLGPLAGQVEVPRSAWYAQAETDEFWDANLDRFPFTDAFPRKRRDVLCIERIFPLPKPSRDRLIDLYCPEIGRQIAKKNAANRDCLVRPLLGRVRQSAGSRLNIFSLRNFKLHFDQIKDIGLEVKDIAYALADALAVLHYHTKIDAMDIEFVLGSSPLDDQNVRRRIPLNKLMSAEEPKSTFGYVTNSSPNFARRVTSLWLLDFDACRDISLDQAGVDLACKAFVETEAYFPRPHSLDDVAQELWKLFGQQYIATAERILEHSHQDLSVKFLDGVTRLLRRQAPSQSLTPPAIYQPRRGSGQQMAPRHGGRGQPSSSRHLATYVPSGSVREATGSDIGSPTRSVHDGMGRGRGDAGHAGGQRGSHGENRAGYRGNFRGGGSGGWGGERRGSGPFASGPWRG